MLRSGTRTRIYSNWGIPRDVTEREREREKYANKNLVTSDLVNSLVKLEMVEVVKLAGW
jgi:hypothetical protein